MALEKAASRSGDLRIACLWGRLPGGTGLNSLNSIVQLASLRAQFGFHLTQCLADPLEDFIEVVPGRAQWW